MPTFERSIEIAAPIQSVYDFHLDTRNAERIARAAATLTDLGAETLGQDVAQAWAATRERVVTATPALLAAGWEFERREARRTWSDPIAEARQSGSWVGMEATGANAHSVLLRARRLSAAS